ncbi:hypothetical protein LOC71_07630 [Rhodopirellula sp. JC740]|uniref:L-seryl-tRNA(Sec) selenium transferase n=1 Tax=Rhodopirellula halodulae TaxID=2894198 RepID=A0ABS8NF06_9BACT|nr:hypothetical protein [Rhodopirellula sp. JC740]MCC9642140.1 hypothetical protein [Rhodopirellula sp. JC740]
MALPPWTVDLLRRGVSDLARQATDPETAQALKDQASKLVEELPRVAREKVDALLKQAETSAAPWRDAWMGTANVRPPQSLINASGNLLHALGSGVAVDPSVLASAAPYLTGDCVIPRDQRITQPTEKILSEACGVELQAMVVSSFDIGLSLLGQMGRRGSRVLVPRCCTQWDGSEGSACLADHLHSTTRGTIREFGSASGATTADLLNVIGSSLASEPGGEGRSRRCHTIVRLAKACCRIAPADRRELGVADVVVMPTARWMGIESGAMGNVVTELKQGADAVLLGGGVMTGTPALGVWVGRTEWMQSLLSDGRASLAEAPAAMSAMVNAAVALARDGGLPVDRLMAASEENLQDRAERLATQLNGVDGVTSTRITQEPARRFGGNDTLPSRQVLLTTNTTSPSVLAERLRSGDTCLLAEPSDDGIALDLRWITPDQQSRIAQRLATAIH